MFVLVVVVVEALESDEDERFSSAWLYELLRLTIDGLGGITYLAMIRT